MRVQFQMFKSHLQSWDTMFRESAAFATKLGPQRLISISHSEDQGKGVVTIWYWSGIEVSTAEPPSTVEELDDIIDDTLREDEQ